MTSPPTTMSIQVPLGYPAVMAVGLGSVLLVFLQGMASARYYRPRAGVKYPAVFASDNEIALEAEQQLRLSKSKSDSNSTTNKDSSKSPSSASPGPKAQFNCAQRAHANTLETLPGFLLALLLAGLSKPRAAAAMGGIWVLARIWFTIAYASGDPKKRFYPFLITFVNYLGLLGTAGHTIYSLWRGQSNLYL